MVEKLDLYDKKILFELDINSRSSASYISKKIKLPKETVNYRIKRLQSRGYIKKFVAIINASNLGFRYYKVYMKLHNIPRQKENEVTEHILHEKNCSNLRLTEGAFNLSFVTIQPNEEDVQAFLESLGEKFGTYLLQKNVHTIIKSHKLNQKFLIDSGTVRKSFNHVSPKTVKIDVIDMKIIRILSNEARKSIVDIGKEVGQDSRLVRYRIKRLEENGIIIAYAPTLDLDKFHRDFVQMDISINNLSKIPSIIEFFNRTNTCLNAYELLGLYDLSVELYLDDDEHLKKIIDDFREKFHSDIIFYDISRIYLEHKTNWSPFLAR